MEINSTNSSFVAATSANQASETSKVSSDFETFLKMLTAQLKNQDPLEPLKSEDFAVQLATFSGVEQQVKTNDLLESLGGQMSVMGMSQLASWVGMESRAPVAGYFDGNPVSLSPNPVSYADGAVLVVTNANGTEIERRPIAATDDTIEWTGELGASTAPHGLYNFSLESYSGEELIATSQVEVYARIVEARADGGQTILVTAGGVEIPAGSVSALREPS